MPKFDYESHTPREAEDEFAPYFESIFKSRKSVTIVANGIGTFCHARLAGHTHEKAYFISPIVNMENLILNMLSQANASEEELRDKGKWYKIRRKTIAQISFATSENILPSGRRRRIFYTTKTAI